MKSKHKLSNAEYAQKRRDTAKAALSALRAVIPDDFFEQVTEKLESTDQTPESKIMTAARLYIEAQSLFTRSTDIDNYLYLKAIEIQYAADFPSHLTKHQAYECVIQVFRRITHFWAYKAKDEGHVSLELADDMDKLNDILVDVSDSLETKRK